MDPEISDEWLVRYFAGACTGAEKAEIEAWMREDPARLRRVRELRNLWEAAGEPPPQQWNVDALWEKFSRRLERAASENQERQPLAADRDPMRSKSKSSLHARLPSGRGLRFAAAMVLVAVTAYVAVQVFPTSVGLEPGATDGRTITTEAGQRTWVRLYDGTRVLLNAQSTLEVPSAFEEKVRKVRLRGEAYFEVVPDEKRPFIVRSGGATTRVLGTSFSVGAYPEDEEVRVVVAEGKVAVGSEQAKKQTVLTKGQLGRLSRKGAQVTRQKVDVNRQLAWTEGRIVFEDASFAEVARKMKRRYDLNIKLADPPGTVARLNAEFKNEPVREVLSVIARTLNMRYEQDGHTVTFYAGYAEKPHSP